MSYIIGDDYLEDILDQGHRDPIAVPRDQLKFYPSSPSAIDSYGNHHGNCVRAMFYKRTGVAPDPGSETDIAGYMIMGSGTAIGERLAQIFQNAGVAVMPNGTEGEQRIFISRTTKKGNTYRISGYIDMICQGPDNELIGYEFKTVWSNGKANRVIKGWRCTPEPDVKNVMQTALYADFARREWGIVDWRLAYFHVQGKVGKVYHVTVDADKNIYVDGDRQDFTVDDIYAQYDKLADAIIEGKEPDREDELWLTDEQVTEMAMNNQLNKKQKKLYEADKKILKPWSACTYCPFVGACHSEKDALEAAEARNL